ncbi:class I SAM-dependent methyltransferase [Rhodothermus profundi]|uniref:Methyltransferase domain-containing protein n=1 Tax=Rhodothermus profundi TaxID=633813 RepID=A0A1M6REK9_9BACT|nr:class I SAM-dependent methyltransferase [Rhodothermus profundi]SHK30921.1 Methyltransferase domain-containing protein [Rhodothermus profundi]
MRYDPVKDRLGRFFGRHPLLQRLFFALLHLIFLRSWYVRRALRRIFARWPTDRRVRVLDAGTGFGQYAYYVARRYPQAEVVGVDLKTDYLEQARRFVARTPVADRVRFLQDDLTRLQTEGPFDLILAVDVLEHIEDDLAVLRNFARVLRPGGYVIINTPSDQGGSDVHAPGQQSFIDEHVREGYSRELLEARLGEAGLEPVESHYSYGAAGALAWRLLIKYPMLGLQRSTLVYLVLPVYYLVVLPVGLMLNALDVVKQNRSGTGLLVVARKPGS